MRFTLLLFVIAFLAVPAFSQVNNDDGGVLPASVREVLSVPDEVLHALDTGGWYIKRIDGENPPIKIDNDDEGVLPSMFATDEAVPEVRGDGDETIPFDGVDVDLELMAVVNVEGQSYLYWRYHDRKGEGVGGIDLVSDPRTDEWFMRVQTEFVRVELRDFGMQESTAGITGCFIIPATLPMGGTVHFGPMLVQVLGHGDGLDAAVADFHEQMEQLAEAGWLRLKHSACTGTEAEGGPVAAG